MPRLTEDQREARYNEMLSWTAERTRSAGRFTAGALTAALHMDHVTWTRFRDRAIEEGKLAYLGEETKHGKYGYAATGVAVRTRSLLELTDLVSSLTRADAKGKVGRPSAARARSVQTLTSAQAQKALTAAGVIARGLTGDKAKLGDVPLTVFQPAGIESGGEELPIIERVTAWSRQFTGSDHSVQSHVGGARLLAAVAAAGGYIPPLDGAANPVAVHAAEWQPTVVRWSKVVQGGRKARNAGFESKRGVDLLCAAATKLGYLSRDDVRWERVIERMTTQYEEGQLTKANLGVAKRAYERLRKASEVEGPTWRRTVRTAQLLVGGPVIRAAVEQGDFAGFVTKAGAFAKGLVEGPFGLRRYLAWSDRKTTAAERRNLQLPPNQPVAADKEKLLKMARREAREQVPSYTQAEATLLDTMSMLLHIAGWLEQTKGVDWANPENDARLLTDPENLREFAEEWAVARGLEKDNPAATLSSMAAVAARLADPFLRAQALAQGMPKLAEQMEARGVTLLTFMIKRDPYAATAARVHAKIAAWEHDGVEAYEKLRRIFDRLVAKVERAGGATIEEQVAALRRGERLSPKLPEAWRVAGRNAVYIGTHLYIPLRRRNTAMVELSKHWSPIPLDGRKDCEPWEGAIKYHFEPAEMKKRRPFDPWLFSPEDVSEGAVNKRLRLLLELYLRAGGIREALLTDEKGNMHGSTRLLVPDRRRGVKNLTRAEASKRYLGRFSQSGITQLFRQIVTAQAKHVGLDLRKLEAVHGAMGPHILRHAFATHLVRLGEVKTASLYLHHKNTTVTEEIYSAFSERHTSVLSAMRAAARKAATRAEDAPTREAARAAGDDVATIAALTHAMLTGKLPKAQFVAAVAALSAA